MKEKLLNKIEDNLINSLMQIDELHLDELLSEAGFNIDSLNQKARQTENQINFLINAISTKTKNDNLLEKATTLFKNAINQNIEKPISVLKSMIEQQKLGLQFRNLDKLTEKEIREIIKDKNLLDIIESLEENEM